ncbi:MAG: peptide deformylase [Pyrinomonadaceae bacterium]
MAIRKIVEHPAKVLGQAGEPVTAFDEDLKTLVADMFETMYDDGGVGLAAQQIGLALRLFVMDCEGLKLVAANPEIISAEGEQLADEGCLSVGKVHAPLKRAQRATLRAQDEHGEWFEREAEGLAARCFQHETDHCDGRLFINRLSPLKRSMVLKRFQKQRKWD